VKRRGKSARGIHHRPESTWPLRKMPTLPLPLRRRELRDLARVVAGRPVLPLVGTQIRRTTMMVVRPGSAAPIAEIACDEVRFFRPDDGAPQSSRACDYEIEVELLAGDERDLRAIVRALRARFDVRPSNGSKLARALRWAGIRVPHRSPS
jgi:inorganic triphosphatase YgiF